MPENFRSLLDALKTPVEPDYDEQWSPDEHIRHRFIATNKRIAALTDLCERVVAENELTEGAYQGKSAALKFMAAKAERLGALLDKARVKLRNYEGWLRAGGALDNSLSELITHIEAEREHAEPFKLLGADPELVTEREHIEPGAET